MDVHVKIDAIPEKPGKVQKRWRYGQTYTTKLKCKYLIHGANRFDNAIEVRQYIHRQINWRAPLRDIAARATGYLSLLLNLIRF